MMSDFILACFFIIAYFGMLIVFLLIREIMHQKWMEQLSNVHIIGLFIIQFIILGSFLYGSIYVTDSAEMWCWFFTITFTIVNVIAILLSFRYFSKSGCFLHEANPIMRKAYGWAGPKLIHIIVIGVRIGINIYLLYELWSNPIIIYEIILGMSFDFYINHFTFCLVTVMFSIELTSNIFENRHQDMFCGDMSVLCVTALDNNDEFAIDIFCSEYMVKKHLAQFKK